MFLTYVNKVDKRTTKKPMSNKVNNDSVKLMRNG